MHSDKEITSELQGDLKILVPDLNKILNDYDEPTRCTALIFLCAENLRKAPNHLRTEIRDACILTLKDVR